MEKNAHSTQTVVTLGCDKLTNWHATKSAIIGTDPQLHSNIADPIKGMPQQISSNQLTVAQLSESKICCPSLSQVTSGLGQDSAVHTKRARPPSGTRTDAVFACISGATGIQLSNLLIDQKKRQKVVNSTWCHLKSIKFYFIDYICNIYALTSAQQDKLR